MFLAFLFSFIYSFAKANLSLPCRNPRDFDPKDHYRPRANPEISPRAPQLAHLSPCWGSPRLLHRLLPPASTRGSGLQVLWALALWCWCCRPVPPLGDLLGTHGFSVIGEDFQSCSPSSNFPPEPWILKMLPLECPWPPQLSWSEDRVRSPPRLLFM